MPGILRIILILTYSRLFAGDRLQPPKEIEITVPNIGEIRISWRPCTAEKPTSSHKYRVKISSPDYSDKYYTSNCETHVFLSVHRGVFAEVATTIFKDFTESSSSESILAELPPSPGEDETAAKNLSCHINTEETMTISLSCQWTPGEKAPLDTEYFMYYRYQDTVEQCVQYVSEWGGQRHVGCRVPSSHIDLYDIHHQVAVLINGSSRTRDIQSMDHHFNSFDIEVLNVPRNVSLQMEDGIQILVWSKPVSVYTNKCLGYEIRIWNLWNNSTKTESVMEDTKLVNGPLQEPWKKHALQVRAVSSKLCTEKVLYSAWTEPLYIDSTSNTIYMVAACVCLILAGLFFMHICLRFKLCKQMFPPVPKPKINLKDIFLNKPHVPDFLEDECWNTCERTLIISSIEEVCESESFAKPTTFVTKSDQQVEKGQCLL